MLRLIDTGNKTLDAALRYAFQKEMMKEKRLSEAEIDRVADRVLSRIRIRLEDEAISKLRDMLNSIGK